MTLCTPFRLRIRPIFKMAKTFSRLASISRSDTMNPRSVPRGTPKTHFLGVQPDSLGPKGIERFRLGQLQGRLPS